MGLSRRLRRLFAGTLASCVLFTQLAVAAYACPQVRQEAADAEAVIAQAAIDVSMAGMPDCHAGHVAKATESGQGSPAQPALCKAHCSNEAQSASRTASMEFPVDIATGPLVRVIEPVPAQAHAALAKSLSPVFGPPPPLPIYLALHVLRN